MNIVFNFLADIFTEYDEVMTFIKNIINDCIPASVLAIFYVGFGLGLFVILLQLIRRNFT